MPTSRQAHEYIPMYKPYRYSGKHLHVHFHVKEPNTASLTSPKSTAGQLSKPPPSAQDTIPKAMPAPALLQAALPQPSMARVKRGADDSKPLEPLPAKRAALERKNAGQPTEQREPSKHKAAPQTVINGPSSATNAPSNPKQETARAAEVSISFIF